MIRLYNKMKKKTYNVCLLPIYKPMKNRPDEKLLFHNHFLRSLFYLSKLKVTYLCLSYLCTSCRKNSRYHMILDVKIHLKIPFLLGFNKVGNKILD